MVAKVFALIATAVALLAAVYPPAPPASAQTPNLRGVYEIGAYFTKAQPPCQDPDCWKPDKIPIPEGLPERRLYLLNDHQYIWGTFYGGYRITRPATARRPAALELCGKEWDADVEPSRLSFFVTATSDNALQKYVLELNPRATIGPPPKVEPEQVCRTQPKRTSRLAVPVVAARTPWPEFLASLQPVTSLQYGAAPLRGVRGDLYLTIHRPLVNPDDLALRNCLVTDGYPWVDLVEDSGAPAQPAYTWPDGRLRTPLRAGATYHLWLRPQKCGAQRQDTGVTVTVPPAPPAAVDEKVVVTCFVAGGDPDRSFRDCVARWVVRP
jgi:hypothetical protein